MKIDFKIIREVSTSKLMRMEKKLRTKVVHTVPIKYLLTIAHLLEVNRDLLRRECREMLRRAAQKTGGQNEFQR